MTDDELKERLKSVPKTDRACSYTIWPFGPEEYKGQRFGSLPDNFLKWIATNLNSSKEDRNQLLAQRAKEELALRNKIIGKVFGYKRSRGFLPKPSMEWSKEKLKWEELFPSDGNNKPNKKSKEDLPLKQKKHGIEL